MALNLFLLFNHELTDLQRRDAEESLGVRRIIDMPPSLKELWRNIPPELETLSDYLKPVKQWLEGEASKGDYVLVQGDFGATYIMVNFSFRNGLIPIYSTTTREAVEEHHGDGSVNLHHVFRHKMFRRYEAEV